MDTTYDEDIYLLLGIQENSAASLVKKGFRNFAKHNHPDLFPGDKGREEKFKKISSAYEKWQLMQNTLHAMQRIKIASQELNDVSLERPL